MGHYVLTPSPRYQIKVQGACHMFRGPKIFCSCQIEDQPTLNAESLEGPINIQAQEKLDLGKRSISRKPLCQPSSRGDGGKRTVSRIVSQINSSWARQRRVIYPDTITEVTAQ